MGAAALILLTALMTACEYKDLDAYGESQEKVGINVRFDWSRVDSIPASMRVVFYPKDWANYKQGFTAYDMSSNGSTVQLQVNEYDVLCWNNDTEHSTTNGIESRETACATTGPFSPHGDTQVPQVLDSIFRGQRVLDYPDYMVHSLISSYKVSEEGQTVTLAPDSMVVTVEIRLHGIKGLENCRKIRGAIDNVAGKRYMAFPNLTEDRVAVMFDAKADGDVVTAKFWVYGIGPTDFTHIAHKMVAFFWVTGSQVFIPIDVTESIARYSTADTYILIDATADLDLATYVRHDATGIIVDAEDWEETEQIPVSF